MFKIYIIHIPIITYIKIKNKYKFKLLQVKGQVNKIKYYPGHVYLAVFISNLNFPPPQLEQVGQLPKTIQSAIFSII